MNHACSDTDRFRTPLTGHIKDSDFNSVYEPAEDSFLLLDTLEKDDLFLQAMSPEVCVEVGCGSGICLTFLAQMLLQPAMFFKPSELDTGFIADPSSSSSGSATLTEAPQEEPPQAAEQRKASHQEAAPQCVEKESCTDINIDAAVMAKRTGSTNNQSIQPIVCNLIDPLEDRLAGSVDVLLFNPPYVVTPSEEVGSKGIEASWAGGHNGREVIDKFLPKVHRLLSSKGVFYLVVIEENCADDLEQVMMTEGFHMVKAATRRAGRELLSVLKFTRLK